MDFAIFSLIAADKEEVSAVLPLQGYEEFAPTLPHIEGPGYFNPGVTKISKEDLRKLFFRAYQKSDAISVLTYDPNGLGKRQYVLVGEFDKKKRRVMAQESQTP